MWLTVGNVLTTFARGEDRERAFLRAYLAFSDPRARFSPAYKAGHWDGKIRMFNERTSSFPTGLLPAVKKGAAKHGITVETHRQGFEVPADGPDPTWLDPLREQPQAFAACLEHGRGIIWSPTGSGKTEIFCALMHKVQGRWCVFVNSKDLMHQAAERFTLRTGEPAGLIGDGIWQPERCTIATFQTLHAQRNAKRTKEFLHGLHGVISDETHLLPANSYMPVIMHAINAAWRFGFSATPIGVDDIRNIQLIGSCGPVIYRTKVQPLIEAGVLSKTRIFVVPHDAVVFGQSWADVYRAGVVLSPSRNDLLVKMALVAPKPCLLFVKHLEHGKVLSKLLDKVGLRREFVHGIDSGPERKAGIKRLVRGDIDVLISSSIFYVGVDIPEVASVIIGSAGKDAKTTLQQIGRGMRVTADKQEVEVWDVKDTGTRWLSEHASDRVSTYLREGHTVIEVQPQELALRAGGTR